MKKMLYLVSVVLFLFVLEIPAQVLGPEPEQNINKRRETSVRNQRITKEQEDKVLNYLKENGIESVKRLELLKESNPRLYNAKIAKLFREISYVESLKDTDPKRYNQLMEERKLTEKSMQLAKEYKNANSESEKKRIKSELESLLYKIFDYRQMNREYEIKRLEKRLNDLKESNQKRSENKKAIVEKRLQQLIGENKYLQW